MELELYSDVATRSGGDIYVGVVGPVRTGKSTLIKKLMAELVLPNVDEGAAKLIMTDELPQSAAGRTIMTTEPKFVPAKAVSVCVENVRANVRFCDCVGFPVEGANGFEEDGAPRLVNTPWSASPLPFAEAATLGTQRVIAKHSTIGLCVTCDGTIAELPREAYVLAEERTVRELKAIGKPFVIVLNSSTPTAESTLALCRQLQEKYDVPTLAVNCLQADRAQLSLLFKAALFEFPVTSLEVNIPDWLQVMPKESSAIAELLERVRVTSAQLTKLRDCSALDTILFDCAYWEAEVEVRLQPDCGKACVTARAKEGIFYQMLSELAGAELQGACDLMRYIGSAAQAKRNFDQLKDALACAKATGYGVVQPDDAELCLEEPRIVRKGANVGIQLRATAPSYHIVKVDVSSEVSPIMGNAAQSEAIVKGMMEGFENNPEDTWRTDVFGKSLRGMVKDGLYGKACSMQEDTKGKLRRTITRIVNEGHGGVICILL